jgi:hypothetical protein
MWAWGSLFKKEEIFAQSSQEAAKLGGRRTSCVTAKIT